jgi:hypothetical protein
LNQISVDLNGFHSPDQVILNVAKINPRLFSNEKDIASGQLGDDFTLRTDDSAEIQ